mmetsp:Transcript_34498/g.53954  ORF Transcript_34498/g.53954 Transcript_34498/m.53954 type:complete len:130 (-) Transcript_34498:1459-1848(-)
MRPDLHDQPHSLDQVAHHQPHLKLNTTQSSTTLRDFTPPLHADCQLSLSSRGVYYAYWRIAISLCVCFASFILASDAAVGIKLRVASSAVGLAHSRRLWVDKDRDPVVRIRERGRGKLLLILFLIPRRI